MAERLIGSRPAREIFVSAVQFDEQLRSGRRSVSTWRRSPLRSAPAAWSTGTSTGKTRRWSCPPSSDNWPS